MAPTTIIQEFENTSPHSESEGHVKNVEPVQNGSQTQIQNITQGMAALATNCSAEEVEAYALSLQKQCRDLLDELEQYQAYLKQKRVESTVEVRHFKNSVQSEMKLLDKVNYTLFSSQMIFPDKFSAGKGGSLKLQIITCASLYQSLILRCSMGDC